MGGFLALIGLLCMVAGFVSLIKPLQFLRIRTRGMAVLVLIAGIAIAAIGGSMAGPAATHTASVQKEGQIADTSKTPAETAAPAQSAQTTQPAQTDQPAPPPQPTKKPALEVIEAKSIRESGVRYVAGTVRNNTNRQYSYVQVEINLYDDSGAQVGSTLANTNNLEPGGTWKFKALVLEDSATKFKIKDVTGF
mgnify:CR=1 FL=1